MIRSLSSFVPAAALLAACTTAQPLNPPSASPPAGRPDRAPDGPAAPATESSPGPDDPSPAYPAETLERLGAELERNGDTSRVLLFGDTLRFFSSSPFFVAGGRVHQLVSPVFESGTTLYLPHQFFAEWLPDRYPDRVAVRGDRLIALRGGAAGERAGDAAARAERPRTADASAAAGEGGATGAAGAAGAAEASADPADRNAPAGSAPAARRVVVLDPGHGGRDPGRIAVNGLKEKAVTLKVSRRLAEVLRDRGYEVRLTRTTDTLIALADRPHMANEWKMGAPASLFMSVHANAWRGPQARGFETFFLSEARTDDERRVAEMENAAVQYESRPVEAQGELDYILNNLRNDFYVRASNALAEEVQDRMAEVHPGPDRGVKQAGFRVLVGAFMPAVLVELAFLSNRREARMLASEDFHDTAAHALADAVDRFFASHEHLWVAEDSPR